MFVSISSMLLAEAVHADGAERRALRCRRTAGTSLERSETHVQIKRRSNCWREREREIGRRLSERKSREREIGRESVLSFAHLSISFCLKIWGRAPSAEKMRHRDRNKQMNGIEWKTDRQTDKITAIWEYAYTLLCTNAKKIFLPWLQLAEN